MPRDDFTSAAFRSVVCPIHFLVLCRERFHFRRRGPGGTKSRSLAACAGRVEEFTTERRRWCCGCCGCGAIDCRQILKNWNIARCSSRFDAHHDPPSSQRERERENDPSSHTNRLDLWTRWLALSSACSATESELKENQCRRTVLGLVWNRSQPIQVIPIHRATVMT